MKSLLDVHPLIVDRVRLAIMVALASSEEPLDFNSLLTSLELTKGNLSSHLRKLEEGGFITVNKSFIGRKPNTTYQETKVGKKAVQDYLKVVEMTLKNFK